MKNLKQNWFFSSNKTLLFIVNLLSVIFFAILYYLIDYIISYHPLFSEKYLLQEHKNPKRNSKIPLFTMKPMLYYLWFSLITQTTVGYTGMISLDDESENFIHMRSTPFKILNIMQLLSIFLIPTLIYSK